MLSLRRRTFRIREPRSDAGIYVNVPLSLIQSVRLVHSLMESSYPVHVSANHRDRFSALERTFDVKYRLGIEGACCLRAVGVDHTIPRTWVGTLSRPLIFPRAIAERTRSLWTSNRPTRFSFTGLVTEKRRDVLSRWLSKADPTERIVCQDSKRGRRFPEKSWDDGYYQLLAQSQFVLCPNGDYIWTYRFFEAILCGAIPVVEETCHAYVGFRYRMMSDPAGDLMWNDADAQHNYERCRDMLTLAASSLDAEIACIRDESPTEVP